MYKNPVLCRASLALIAWAALGCPGIRSASANADLDRKYALESVGLLKAWDNVDGLFADYVSSAFRDYFSRQSRFVLQDLSKGDNILTTSRIPYVKLIDNPEVLGQLARSTRSQSLIRTKIRKEGAQYHFDIDWLHSPDMEIMSREEFTLDEPRGGEGFGSNALKARLEAAVDRAIRKVPFVGAVTGRDNASVTVNIGASSGIEPGDTLVIGTIEQAKRHPLLKEIVEWSFLNTGKARIETVEDRIAFGKIIEEEPGRQIMRQQKILQVIKPAAPSEKIDVKDVPESVVDEPPRLGWVDAGLNLGGFSRSYSAQNNSVNKDGGGFAYGLKASGQLWITRDWFGEMGFNFAAYSYSQKDVTPGTTPSSEISLGSGSLLGFRIAAGYNYYLTSDIFGPKGWLKVGYRSNAYSLPESAADATASITFHSLFVGIGGEVPVRGGYGAILDFGLGIFNSASENTQLSGSETSASDVSFSLGAYYRYTPRITFRATLDGQFNGADFSTARSVSQHVLTFVPAAVFFF